MYEESAGRIMLRYAVPQMVGLLFNSVYIIVDGVFIGNRLGSRAMAAAGVAVPVVELLIAISMAVTAGAGVTVSMRLAKGNREAAVGAFNASMFLQGVIGAAIAGAPRGKQPVGGAFGCGDADICVHTRVPGKMFLLFLR